MENYSVQKTIETFSVKEILESALRGFMMTNRGRVYETVFYNNTDDMKNAKMYTGIWDGDIFYEMKVTRKRDRIMVKTQTDVPEKGRAKLYYDFAQFFGQAYPILSMVRANDRLYIQGHNHDYEVIFVLKRDVKRI